MALAGFPLDTAAQLAWGGSVCLTVPLSSPLSSKWDPMVASCSPCLPSCPGPWSCEYLPLSPFIVGLAPRTAQSMEQPGRRAGWGGEEQSQSIYTSSWGYLLCPSHMYQGQQGRPLPPSKSFHATAVPVGLSTQRDSPDTCAGVDNGGRDPGIATREPSGLIAHEFSVQCNRSIDPPFLPSRGRSRVRNSGGGSLVRSTW